MIEGRDADDASADHDNAGVGAHGRSLLGILPGIGGFNAG
jgi:hypothetical protein